MKKKGKAKNKKCGHCGEKCEQWEKVIMFGSTFCLHDQALDTYHAARGMPLKNNPGISVKEAKFGKNSAEEKYIDKANRRGNAVIRGSDGLLREVGKKK